MDKSKLYVFIILIVCFIISAICIPLLIKNGSYSAIFSALLPIVLIVVYLIYKKLGNDNEKRK
ncbi:hypothetical protein [Staphylococcus caeli]|uniref:Uncharacterized protein n=1 Tax=Staphylococcus caeli TaxID=2201815 RepID=A0A1D4L6P5_9STAP|nr:hypothetical protein [Staphylococcus caeli]SCS81968.1 Uncharacterised protein [Staphylococcus caeli]SCT00737.1 Uncharacterised protein [Staphylococcus caeli]